MTRVIARLRVMARIRGPLVLAALVLAALAACAGGATPGPSGSPAESVTGPDQAVARVVAVQPEFEGIGPFDPDRIGGCCWYRVNSVEGGYEVVFRIGWGDCPAGCIDEHLWTYRVGADGSVGLVAESGDPVPSGGIPTNGGG